MPPVLIVLIVLTVLLLGLVANAACALATNRPHSPAIPALAAPLDPMLALARGLQVLADRHPDGTSHHFITPTPAAAHPCGDYCHHAAIACYCGASRLRGYSVPEVR